MSAWSFPCAICGREVECELIPKAGQIVPFKIACSPAHWETLIELEERARRASADDERLMQAAYNGIYRLLRGSR